MCALCPIAIGCSYVCTVVLILRLCTCAGDGGMTGCKYYMGQVLWLRVAHTKSHSNTQDTDVHTKSQSSTYQCMYTHTQTQNDIPVYHLSRSPLQLCIGRT